MTNGNGETPQPVVEKTKDEHGCVKGEERWDEEQQKCVPIQKTPAEHTMDQVMAENKALKQKLASLQKTVDELRGQLKAANDVLEAQIKAELISEIMPRSSYTIEDLHDKSVDELKNIHETLRLAVPPTYKGIHVGPIGLAADERQDQEGLTVGDLSIPTQRRRKG